MSSLALLLLQLAGTGPDPVAVRRQLDSVGRDLAAAREAIGRREGGRDSVTVGALTLVGAASLVARYRPALPAATDTWATLFDGAAPRVTVEVVRGPWSGPERVVARWLDGPADQVAGLAVGRSARPVASLRLVLGDLLLLRADSALRSWVTGVRVGDLTTDADEVAYQFATAAGPAATACRNRDAGQCPIALGLTMSRGPKEYSGAIRSSLLGYTLVRGGKGAWTRLTADSGPVADRLVRAAGAPSIAAVFSSWRAEVVAAGRDTGPLDGWRWVAGGLWLILAAILAIGGRPR